MMRIKRQDIFSRPGWITFPEEYMDRRGRVWYNDVREKTTEVDRMLYLHENLRKFRGEKGLTQEEVAAVLGVSPQAVSRWETGSACPDAEFLPSLANFYGVTLDELVGMDRLRDEDSLRNVFCETHDLVQAGEAEKAVETLRRGLRNWPGNAGLLSELALALTGLGDRDSLTEAAGISEKLLLTCENEAIRSTVRANLCRVWLGLGKAEKARCLARTLPHVWECREVLLPEAAPEFSEKCMNILLAVLRDKLGGKTPDLMLGHSGREDVQAIAALLEGYHG